MHILFVCKASTHIGFGHLIRSKTLASKLSRRGDVRVTLAAFGDEAARRLLRGAPFEWHCYFEEDDLVLNRRYDLCFFDMTQLKRETFYRVAEKTRLCAGLSPVFNLMSELDLLFHRTRYFEPAPERGAPKKLYAGLEYAIIQENCTRISTATYESNLELERFPVALSMGGGDAANLTLRFLRVLKECPIPATFWVMLGEGYRHSYDELVEEVSVDGKHEIILAKTNRSMWQILKNGVLSILPSGITSFEAAYAGLPSINFLYDARQAFLLRELVEHNVCFLGGVINGDTLDKVNEQIERLYADRRTLLQYHINSKGLIPEDSSGNILEVCRRELS